jgi:hypothetical protein
MFPHVHIFAFIAGGAFVAMILASVIGGYLERAGLAADQQQFLGRLFTMLFGILFIVLCMALMPLFLRFFTHMQGVIGNGELGMVRFIRENERTITYVVWGIIAVFFMFVMLPTMTREGGIT